MCTSGTFVSIDDAARMLETTPTRILMMLKRHEISGSLVGETWQVDKASLRLCSTPKPSVVVRNGGCGGGCGSGCGGH